MISHILILAWVILFPVESLEHTFLNIYSIVRRIEAIRFIYLTDESKPLHMYIIIYILVMFFLLICIRIHMFTIHFGTV